MRSRGLTLVDVVVVACVFLVIACFVVVSAEAASYGRRGAGASKCANNLKQLAFAAISYSDEHHYFPHVGPLDQLDGGYKSNTATRVVRALTYFTYDDNPWSYACPDSPDECNSYGAAASADLRAFRWEHAEGPPAKVSPLAPDGADAHDVPLDRSTELSYGWTRKAYGSNSSSSSLLAADKSMLGGHAGSATHQGNMVGNHDGFMNAVCVDSHTMLITRDSYPINTLSISADLAPREPGYMGVLGDDPSLGQ